MSLPPRIAHVTTIDATLRFLLLPQLIRLRDEGFEVVTISAPGPWTKDVEAEGIRHIPWLHATRSWNPVEDVRAFRELVGIFRRERFHLVHTHNPKPSLLGRTAARLVRVPIIVNTTHGFYASPDDRWARRVSVLALERFAARFSDLELYQSEEDLQWARRSRVISPSRSLLLGNGVNIREFDPSRVSAQERTAVRRELGIPDDAVLVGTVARLVLEKGYRELFAAAARIHASLPEVRFIAVGPQDPDKSDAIGRDELDRAAPDVIFTGHRRDILPLLAAMDIFVLPSWREGVPRSAIEAAAMGKPLVLTNIRGCREVARHGIDGLLVPPRDSRRLARAIEQLIRDPELRKRMGAAARTRVEERFDERTVIDLIVAQYRSLLARHGFAEPLGDHATPPVPGSMSR